MVICDEVTIIRWFQGFINKSREEHRNIVGDFYYLLNNSEAEWQSCDATGTQWLFPASSHETILLGIQLQHAKVMYKLLQVNRWACTGVTLTMHTDSQLSPLKSGESNNWVLIIHLAFSDASPLHTVTTGCQGIFNVFIWRHFWSGCFSLFFAL